MSEPSLFERRRRLLAGFNQNKAAHYAAWQRKVRDEYLGSWWNRWLFDRTYQLELCEQYAALSEIYALTARMLMDTQDAESAP